MVIDGRTNEQFDEAHIEGALSASAYDTGFATKVSRVAPAGSDIIVVAAPAATSARPPSCWPRSASRSAATSKAG